MVVVVMLSGYGAVFLGARGHTELSDEAHTVKIWSPTTHDATSVFFYGR